MIGGLIFFGVQSASTRFIEPNVASAETPPQFAITHGAVRAIVAPLGHAAPRGREAMLHHHRTVLALFRAGPVLPARFNARFDGGVSATRRWLDARHDAILARLAEVKDCVEVGYRIMPTREIADDDAISHDGRANNAARDGARYLRARRAALHREASADAHIAAAAARLHRAIAADTRALTERWRATPNIEGGVALVGAVLTPAERAVGVIERINTIADARARVRVAATGPFPPYSFADLDTPLAAPAPESSPGLTPRAARIPNAAPKECAA